MASSLSMWDRKAYHILSYGTFIGATFFQSFIAGPVAYKALPRALFGRLQESITPVFFALQTGLSVLVMLTFPGEQGAALSSQRASNGISGVLEMSNVWNVSAPLLLMLGTSAANLAVLGPLTTKTMKLRHHQETRDGKKSYDAGLQSAEMQALNRRFGMLHGVSSALDLVGYLASMYYGFYLAAEM